MTRYLYQSPIGTLELVENESYITQIRRLPQYTEHPKDGSDERLTDVIAEAVMQLTEYFQGKRKVFALPIRYSGTKFQEMVWSELQKIPYGETRSYADIARQIGQPKAVRAVGGANHRNPLLLVVPCHRVIQTGGGLGGFGCGVEIKQFLLELEQCYK